jgi:hypothetical protein
VVDNDGIHATATKTGKARLKKGVRRVTVTFFQGGGEATLEARVSGPGVGEADLGSLIAASEDELKKRPAPKAEGDEALKIDPALVKKGAGLFASLGCASCHQLTLDGKAIAAEAKAPALAKLDAAKGCLSEAPARGLPRYGLDEGQKKSIALALGQKQPEAKKAPAEAVADAMLTFNCYACHVRDKVGGPQDEINKTFQTTQPEMGDEGRLPPPLDGVGAKLNKDYFAKILDQGADDRPYMLTMMPGFGAANVGHLVEAFGALDKLPAVGEVKFHDLSPSKVKAEGRRLAGAENLACIKCHTFAGQKAEGVQGIDMVKMPARVRRDWFHAYVTDPQTIRPGTRMPSSFIKGKSAVLGDILDGTALQQVEAMWQYLSDGAKARPPLGVGKAYIPLVPEKSAILYRNFLTDGHGQTLPRGIAVGYPEKAHLAFDANEMRLAAIWQGLFIDAALHWTDRGPGFQSPLGDNVLKMPAGPTVAVLAKADDAWPATAKAAGAKFAGYKLTKDDRPTFLYAVGGVSVEDFPNAVKRDKEAHLERTITLKADKAPAGVSVRAAVANKISEKDGWFVTDDGLRLKVTGKGKAAVRKSGGKEELVWAAEFDGGKSSVTIEYAW